MPTSADISAWQRLFKDNPQLIDPRDPIPELVPVPHDDAINLPEEIHVQVPHA
jgi:hypothetical protein